MSDGSRNHGTEQILQTTFCLLRVQSSKMALGKPARFVQAGGGMEVSCGTYTLTQLFGPGPSAVGRVEMRTCEKRETDYAPLMASC